MLLQIFISVYLLAIGTPIVESRTEYIDLKHSNNDVDCKTPVKYDERGVKICNDNTTSKDNIGELKKVQNMDNDSRFLDGNEMDEVLLLFVCIVYVIFSKKGRRKKNKGFGRILLFMVGAAKATILYITIHAVAAIAAKALIVAKVALAVATAIALKKASEHGDKTSYEIVKHPHHSYIQTHSSSIDYDHHGGYESGYSRRKRRRVLR
ncbi:hypothetical protein M0802_008445 [Mischocyttarus mexicanus]|nr:hypothetical protein M0802_008445 [Mischocyttarus mexicanus]